MDIYNGYSSHFQHDLHDLVDCDIKDLDVNYNDPAFNMNVYTDMFHQIKSEKSCHGSLPADLTNLQWLHSMNVALPVEQGGHDGSVMVDPNTAMPVQSGGWPSPAVHNNNIPTLDKPKNNVPISAKEDNNTKEKIFPKPVFSYSCLIAMALKDSEAGTLPVSEIYKFMQGNFPYFKTAPDGWKNSVRHNLSLNKAFCKLDRPQGTSQRKGCLWTLKPEKKEQMAKEIKKWKKKHAESIKASMARPDEFHIANEELDHSKFHHKTVEDHSAAANAAKDLFGNGIMEEINSEAFWDDIMSSSSPDSLKYVDTSYNSHESYPSEVSTTVEVDSSAQYYNNEYNIPNVGHYYNTNIYPQTVNY